MRIGRKRAGKFSFAILNFSPKLICQFLDQILRIPIFFRDLLVTSMYQYVSFSNLSCKNVKLSNEDI